MSEARGQRASKGYQPSHKSSTIVELVRGGRHGNIGRAEQENPNGKAKTPHLEDNLVIIKDPKGRVCVFL